MDWEGKEIPLSWQSWLLGLNRTGLYYVPAPLSEEELLLRRRIDEIHTDQPCYGSRRKQASPSWQGEARKMRTIGDFFQLNCHSAFTCCNSIAASNRSMLRSLVEEHLGGVQNRRLLVWSLLNVEELFVKTS